MAIMDIVAAIDAEIASLQAARALLAPVRGGVRPTRAKAKRASVTASPTDAAILDVLAEAGAPMKKDAIAKAVKIDAAACAKRLKVLVLAGDVAKRGKTFNVTYTRA
jgi:hypothetical protein